MNTKMDYFEEEQKKKAQKENRYYPKDGICLSKAQKGRKDRKTER